MYKVLKIKNYSSFHKLLIIMLLKLFIPHPQRNHSVLIQMKHSFHVSSHYRLIINLVKNELKVNRIYERYFCIDAVLLGQFFAIEEAMKK